jgi:hypothetical protein
MSLFNKQTAYVSDFTRFISDMKQENPKLEADQRAGRARLWDKEKLDLEEMRRVQESRVNQKAYVYQSQ